MDNDTNNNELNNKERLSAKQTIKQLLPDINIDPNLKPSKFIDKYWEIYQSKFPSNQNVNGKVFEELIAICLIREKVLPFYMQAQVAFIPYVNYDFIIYTNELGPISLSAKTSLRERWKQADLEAVALKYIHRRSVSYVITMDLDAVRRRRVDTSQTLGIDSFVLANTDEFDEMIISIKRSQLVLSPTVEVVTSSVIITAENYQERYS